MLFNREKYYMFGMEEDFYPNTKLWTYNAKREYYTVGPIDKCLSKDSKKILCLNRLAWPKNRPIGKRIIARTQLAKVLADEQDIYLSDPNVNNFFYPNQYEEGTIDVLHSGGTWYPAADFYYNSSYVSAYIESVTDAGGSGNTFCATEKTYDPLIKGHFILPFAYPGIISDIRKIGFILPDWIDYSYDTIVDVDERFKAYSESVLKIINLSDFDLIDLYEQDKWMLDHNRNLFFIRPYDSLSKKIKKAFDMHNY